MEAVNYSELRKNLKSVLDGVCENHEPTIITRKNSDNLVLLSYEDYSAIEETAYLLRSPKNAQRLRESIENFNNDKGKERKLIEVKD
ncbi:MAG: type II toxin-antitoxin system prevent-host-death family antitoxin [Deltaproteobacteria bacterium]|nr:type II toxin-antitoxin system prevent-host-death family antitoxin [Deltaproteobacteria bacterium]MBT4526607.1 type II toxin-antitoxin system prevent-host-death family antitoxin [Deltaproteobacteria bacterium]